VEYCPSCRTERTGSFRFCRSCGFDFDTSTPGAAGATMAHAVATSTPADGAPTSEATSLGAPPVATQSAATPGQGFTIAPVAVAIGGALYAVGSALPWISVSAPFVGTITRSGLDGGGDGIISLAIGVAIALIGIAAAAGSKAAGSKVAIALLTLVALGFAGWEITNINSRIDDLDSSIRDLAVVGIGLWMMVVGSGIAFLASLSIRRAAGA
jgi:hypothetical protein